MKSQTSTTTQNVENQTSPKSDRPRYEAPRIQAMSEQDILKSFQITQSMMGWWVGSC
jgi:hypothetical protein